MRLPLAVLLGSGTTVACAVVLGDYPLSGSVPWAAAVVIPLLIGAVMTLVAGGHRRAMWVATGPLALIAMGWGVRIATGWGLDPVPASCWMAMAVSVLWPVGWGVWSGRRSGRAGAQPAPRAAQIRPVESAAPAGRADSVDG